MNRFNGKSQMGEPFYQITLDGPVWDESERNDTNYNAKLDTLKTDYLLMVLRDTVQRNTDSHVFKKNVLRDVINPGEESVLVRNLGLCSHVKKDLWMPNGLALWMRFTDNKLLHWCQFMNESLINSLFLAVKVFYSCLNGQYYRKRTGLKNLDEAIDVMDTDRLRGVLVHTLSTFFDNHNKGKVNCDHVFGLAAFYGLNVEHMAVPNVTMTVPHIDDGVDYDRPADFVENWMRYSNEVMDETIYENLHSMMDESFVHDHVGRKIGLDARWKAGENGWGKQIEKCFRQIANLPHTESTQWCKMMSDELVSQIYTTVSSVLHVLNTEQLNRGHSIDYIRLPMIRQSVQRTYFMFFLIDSRTPCTSDGMKRANEADKQIAQWSGNWGMSMFIQQNFKPITGEYYDTLYGEEPPELTDDEDAWETQSDSQGSEGDGGAFPFSDPQMTQRDYRERALAFAPTNMPNMLRDRNTPAALEASNLTPELLQMIMRQIATNRRPKRV